jgi:hypothetical protein
MVVAVVQELLDEQEEVLVKIQVLKEEINTIE